MIVLDYLFRGIIIGILFGVPVGAVGAMVVQRTWTSRFCAGLLTGLGSSAADCFYASAGIFGMTFITNLLTAYQREITVVGSAVVMYMGLRLLTAKKSGMQVDEKQETIGFVRTFLSSFAVGITNPASILTFLVAFTSFGISSIADISSGVLLVLGVLAGTLFWWVFLSLTVCTVRKKADHGKEYPVSRISGLILIVFSVVIFLRIFR